jgi:hypothetical protein
MSARVSQQLESFQPTVASSVVAALQPQIAKLQFSIAELKADATSCNIGAASLIPSGLDPTDMVEAVTGALSSRFEELTTQTAAAAAIAATAAAAVPQPSESSAASLHDIASSLVKEMVGPLETSIEEALAPRIAELQLLLIPNLAHEQASSDEVEESMKHPVHVFKHTFRKGISSMSSVGYIRRQSTRARNTLPSRAFVVNFRRLVEVQKILALIHEFIRSTAIATLTLVAAANWKQLTFSIVFVSLVLALFTVHEMRHDRMDIEDYRSLVELLEDDVGSCNGCTVDNPNRMLKALSISRNKHRRSRSFITAFSAVGVVLLVWVNIIWSWASHPKDEKWLGVFNEEDRVVQATLLLVGTAMVAFHISFEWIYWRETQCVMPNTDGQRAWDPRTNADGVPSAYRWFGLPSMWFTSREAYDDLRLWITLSCKDTDQIVTKIHPEEMALFALKPEGAAYLRRTLGDAKLFSMGTWEFLSRSEDGLPRPVGEGEQPDRLGMAFVFFDSASQQFLQPEEDYRSGLMRLLTRTVSDLDHQQQALIDSA